MCGSASLRIKAIFSVVVQTRIVPVACRRLRTELKCPYQHWPLPGPKRAQIRCTSKEILRIKIKTFTSKIVMSAGLNWWLVSDEENDCPPQPSLCHLDGTFCCESLLSHVQCAAFEFDQYSRGSTLPLNLSHFQVAACMLLASWCQTEACWSLRLTNEIACPPKRSAKSCTEWTGDASFHHSQRKKIDGAEEIQEN